MINLFSIVFSAVFPAFLPTSDPCDICASSCDCCWCSKCLHTRTFQVNAIAFMGIYLYANVNVDLNSLNEVCCSVSFVVMSAHNVLK